MDPLSIIPGFSINWGTFILPTVTLFFSFVLSGAGIALPSLTSQNINKLKESNKSSVVFFMKTLRRKPNLLMNTIIIGDDFMHISFIVASAKMLIPLFAVYSPLLSILFLVLSISLFLILFGGLIPKRIASNYSSGFILSFSTILKINYYIFLPLSILLLKLVRMFKLRYSKIDSEISIDILTDVINHSPNQSVENKMILKAIVNSVDTEVRDIFCPRIDIEAIDVNVNFTELTGFISDTIYSRIPVYKNSLDNIVGVLYIKDLLPYIRVEGENFNWQKLLRKHYVAPETKLINDLLDEFQRNKVHIAIVVDEYGGTSGIITLEDILEEIVGEILDETDSEEELPVCIENSDGSLSFEAKTPLKDFYRVLQKKNITFEEQEGDAESIGGLLLEVKGDFLEEGEKIEIDSLVFEVIKVDDKRALEIKLKYNNE